MPGDGWFKDPREPDATADIVTGPGTPPEGIGSLRLGVTADDQVATVTRILGGTLDDPNLFVCRDSAGQVTLPPALCTASAPNAAVANDQNAYTRSLAIPLP